jgi:hypothetical protein
MKRLLAVLLAVLSLVALPSSGRADIIFNNFDPGDMYYLYGGRTLLNRPYEPDPSERLAVLGCAFTPTASYSLDSVKLAAFSDVINTSPALDVLLMSDKNGLPGSVIESIRIPDATGDFGQIPNVAASALRPILDANTQYWIVAYLPPAPQDGEGLGWWAPPLTDDRGPEAEMNFGTGWQLGDTYRWAFSVSGTPVPEPATVLLLTVGTLGGLLWGWQRRRRTA